MSLKAAADRGEPDDGSQYYHHWLAALERLVDGQRIDRSGGHARAQRGLGRSLSAHSPRQARRASSRQRVSETYIN